LFDFYVPKTTVIKFSKQAFVWITNTKVCRNQINNLETKRKDGRAWPPVSCLCYVWRVERCMKKHYEKTLWKKVTKSVWNTYSFWWQVPPDRITNTTPVFLQEAYITDISHWTFRWQWLYQYEKNSLRQGNAFTVQTLLCSCWPNCWDNFAWVTFL
jgi:hypothetical protein